MLNPNTLSSHIYTQSLCFQATLNQKGTKEKSFFAFRIDEKNKQVFVTPLATYGYLFVDLL